MKFLHNPGTFHWRSPDGKHIGSFRPTGKMHLVNPDQYNANPRQWMAKDTVSARLFVGFNVGEKQTWTMDDLINIVERVRIAQGDKPDSSFIAQMGLYTSEKDGKTVREHGAQVVIFATDKEIDSFIDKMVDLAEIIAGEMMQEVVIVDVQQNGMSINTIGVTPK